MQTNIKYRTWWKGIPPKPIKLEIPGWAGEKNWDCGQPWHCKPFKDGSTYGLELIYPFDTEVTVTTKNGELVWTGDFSKEVAETDQKWERPFSSFAPGHFGFTSSLDLKTDPGYAIMLLPHPRFYTDRTGTVPLITTGIIESDFWPRVFFIVFKSPLEGQTYVFRKGEGYGQIIVVPKKVDYKIAPMTEEEIKDRSHMEQILSDHRKKIATNTWKTLKGEEFDNKYKILSAINSTKGEQGVKDYLNQINQTEKSQKEDKQKQARKKFPRKIFNAKNKLQG